MRNNSFFGLGFLNSRGIFPWLFIIVICFAVQPSFARKVHNRHAKFKITLPNTMKIIKDTGQGDIYYDSVTNIVLIISARESKFHEVDEYINCNWKELETILKNWSADSTLQIISCNKSRNATILHFKFNTSLNEYEDNIIYFIHHKREDMQFSFISKAGSNDEKVKYADNIMRSLKLK